MLSTVEWGTPQQTVIIQTYTGNWTIQDQLAIADQSKALSETVPHQVHVIVDVRKAYGVPKMLVSQIAPELERRVPQNQGQLVVVGASKFIQGLIEIAKMVAPRATDNLHFVRTLDQAWALLQKEAGVEPPPPQP
jgi:hypothetical protein